MARYRKIALLIIVNVSLFLTTFLNEMVITVFPAYRTSKIMIENVANNTNATLNSQIDNSKVAFLLGIKYGMQIVAFPISGIITDKVSPGLVMLIGLVLESISYFFYCASESLLIVSIARLIDGVGSAFYNTAALTLIYVITPSNQFRNKLITINNIFMFFAISTAPSISGMSYQYTLIWTNSPNAARWITFSIIGPIMFLITITTIPFVCYPSNKKHYKRTSMTYLKSAHMNPSESFTHLGIIVKDPYILITLAYIAILSIPLNSFQTTLPTYMNKRFGSDETMQGVAWLGCFSSIPGFLLGSVIYHKFIDKCWLVCMLNLQIIGFVSMTMMFVEPWWTTTIILGIINFCSSIIEVILVPFIAILIDKRYTRNYGGSSSLTMLSYTFSAVLATFPSGFIVEKTNFSVLCYILIFICVPLSPMIFFCRKYFKNSEVDLCQNYDEEL